MPLVSCPTCEKQISSNAYACTNCGEILKGFKHVNRIVKVTPILMSIFIFAMVLIMLFPYLIKFLSGE